MGICDNIWGWNNNKTLEHGNLILLNSGCWRMKSCWIYCKTLNLIFSNTNIGLIGVYVLSSISRIRHNFSTGAFSMYRGILELKIHASIFRRNCSFANETYFEPTALLVKTKIYFYPCNFANKQINKNSYYSQTCIRRSLLGPLKSGCLGQVVVL